MSLELFTIDNVAVTFSNHIMNLVLDDTNVMKKQLEYVLRGEILRMKDRIGSEGVPCTPDTIKSLIATSKEFEDICFPTYSVNPEAEISTKYSVNGDSSVHNTTVTIVVHIREAGKTITTNTQKGSRLYPTTTGATNFDTSTTV